MSSDFIRHLHRSDYRAHVVYNPSTVQKGPLIIMLRKTAPSELTLVPKLVGKYKQVRVTFLGASFRKPTANSQSYADDQFAPYVLDEIFKRQGILSRVKGLISKTHHCRKCDADLMGLKAHRRRFSLSITYKDQPSFKLEIEMPAIPCKKCGTSNAINESGTEDTICGAIAKAFVALKGLL
jgi:hypothetical protein